MCDGARDGRFIDNPFGTRGQQTCRPVDEVDRHPADLSRPNTSKPARGTQDLSVSFAQCED